MKPSFSRWLPILLVLAVFMLPSCSTWDRITGKKSDPPPPPPPPPTGQYLDFDDVKIPAGLDLDRDESFVYESQSIKAGVLTFSGMQKVTDMLTFFQDNMVRDGWKQMSSFKYRKNILIYTKPGKVCLIVVVYPPPFNKITVEVWVSPLRPEAAGAADSAPKNDPVYPTGAGSKPGSMLKPGKMKVEPLPGKYPFPGLGPFTLLGESNFNYWGKMMFKWVYFNLMLKGHELPLESQMFMAGKMRHHLAGA